MSSQIKTLCLFIVALAILACYAFMPEDLSFNEEYVKKLDFSALYEADSTAVAEADSTLTAEIEKKEEKKELDTTSQRILFFGDSMLEGLTLRASDYAFANGHELWNALWYSSNTKLWAETQTLEYNIREVNPTFIICCLGSNEQFFRDVPQRKEYIKAIVNKMGNIPFIWICPPAWKQDAGINEAIRTIVGDERFFDSRKLTFQRGKDHVHPTFSSAAVWFDHVAEWLQSDSTAHPIIMKVPTEKHKREHHKIYQPTFPGEKL
jgi:lysophospholipase L1-like esterase